MPTNLLIPTKKLQVLIIIVGIIIIYQWPLGAYNIIYFFQKFKTLKIVYMFLQQKLGCF